MDGVKYLIIFLILFDFLVSLIDLEIFSILNNELFSLIIIGVLLIIGYFKLLFLLDLK